jgi:hypothetical protein
MVFIGGLSPGPLERFPCWPRLYLIITGSASLIAPDIGFPDDLTASAMDNMADGVTRWISLKVAHPPAAIVNGSSRGLIILLHEDHFPAA